ncbi:hypothetical protein D3C72_2424770 [compost metagenome]
MAHYADRGLEIFDFGPSNGLEGVIQFKESFGARAVPFSVQHANTLASRCYLSLRARVERLQVPRALARPLQPTPAGT